MPRPKDQKELQAFLGMVNHYGKFMHNLSESSPVKECKEAFLKIKEKLARISRGISSFQPIATHFLAADASLLGIGAVIFHHYPDGTEKAIAHTYIEDTYTYRKELLTN